MRDLRKATVRIAVVKIVLSLVFATSSLANEFAKISETFREAVESSLTGQAVPGGNKNSSQLNSELKALVQERTPESLMKAQKVGHDLALALLAEYRVQEAIWSLDRAGLFGHGEFLTEQLKNFMHQGATRNNVMLGGGVSNSLKVTFSQRHSAIAKLVSSDRVAGDVTNQSAVEVFGYELDRYIGLGRVSTTILRDFPEQGQKASFQAMVPGQASNINFRDKNYADGLQFLDEVYLFDLLIENSDRHYGNSLLTPLRELVLIDQGRSYYHIRSGGAVGNIANLRPGVAVNEDLLRNLHDIPLANLRAAFSPLITDKLVDRLTNNIQKIKQTYPRPNGPSIRRRGWELENLRALPIAERQVRRQEAPKAAAQAAPQDKYNLQDFESHLDAARSEGVARKTEHVKYLAAAMNDANFRGEILANLASRKRLAHFVEGNVNLLNSSALRDYINAASAFVEGEGRGIDRAVKSCRAAVKKKAG